MYYKDHTPPHVHAEYQDNSALIDINNAEIVEGVLPARYLRFVQAWVEIHRDELLADWKLCRNGEEPFTIAPLK
ncbi:hypothetical protein FACS1894199_15140 [Bacteroidia bacterium]|nr:hypothetical protein FACS1894199_15140 [Bacteroidia bacterium]